MKIMSILFFSMLQTFTFGASQKNLAHVITSKLEEKGHTLWATYYGPLTPEIEIPLYSPVSGVITKGHSPSKTPLRKGDLVVSLTRNDIGLETYPVKIKAPVSGLHYRPSINKNAFVQKDQLIGTLYSQNKFFIPLHISVQDSKSLRRGSEALISVDGKKIKGLITEIDQALDLETGAIRAKVQAEAQGQLIGQVVEVSLNKGSVNGLKTLKKWVVKKDDHHFLRVLEKSNKVKWIKVKKLAALGQEWIIEKNTKLKNNNIIIKANRDQLKDGEEVILDTPSVQDISNKK